MTREELSELDKRIAASVARGEAAIARQEIAVARQEAAIARADETRDATMALIAKHDAERAERNEQMAEIMAELREGRDERRAMIESLMRMVDRLPPPAAA